MRGARQKRSVLNRSMSSSISNLKRSIGFGKKTSTGVSYASIAEHATLRGVHFQRVKKSRATNFANKIKRIPQARRIQILGGAALAMSALVGLVVVTDAWRVNDVEISGNVNILQEDLINLKGKLKGENLVTLKQDEYISDLSKDPYVKGIYIEKQYPGKVVVKVEEAEPKLNFYSLDTAYILDKDAKLLSEYTLDEEYPISEEERLIYISAEPFRSKLLKDKWLVENLSKQRDLYLEEQKKKLKEANTENIDVTAEPVDQQKELEKFIDENFKKVPLARLRPYYQQLKAEVDSTVEARWDDLEKEIPKQRSETMVYSLIPKEDVVDFDTLTKSNYFSYLEQGVGAKYEIERIEVVSPTTIRLNVKSKMTDTTDSSSVLLFTTQKSLDLQFVELETVESRLVQENKIFKHIDLTGKKIVVGH